MKKLMISLLLTATMIGCDKKLGDLEFNGAIPGGCAAEKGASHKSSQITDADKVTYSVIEGNLEILVGFNATCCGEYSTSSEIKGNTIYIKILTTQPGLCDCICYYTYNFKFTGSGENYNYHVTVDDTLTFTGKIKP